MREIANFIKEGGFFPNNIIVNFTKPVRFDKVANDEVSNVVFGTLTLPDRYRSAWVIDGQHRLYGFAPLPDNFLDHNIVVLAFEQMPKVDEANIFVSINHEQRSVPKHLLDDLEGELKWGSSIPSERIGAIAARLINVLNTDVGEPLFNRITQQGLRSTNKACLTIPAIKDALRRFGLLGRGVMKDNHYELGPLSGKNDNETLDRSRRALSHYFEIVRGANIVQWELGREGWTCTNVAIQGYIQLLASLIRYWEGNTASDAKQMEPEELVGEIEEFMSPIVEFLETADEKQLENEFRVPFGSGGPREFYYRLCRRVKAKVADFEPDGLSDWEVMQSQENVEAATKQIRDLEIAMKKAMFSAFRTRFGEEANAYWERGVPIKEVKTKAYDRSQEAEFEERLPLETYVDLIDLKKIAEHKQNWDFLKDIFNITEPGEKGLAKNLKWIDRLNELRRISAHPSDKRQYKLEDLEYTQFVHDEFFRRLVAWSPLKEEVGS